MSESTEIGQKTSEFLKVDKNLRACRWDRDKRLVATLGATASQILETAVNVGGTPVTILLKAGRVVEMTTANDWSLDALLLERGVDEVYRVSRHQGQTRVEARSRQQTCSVVRRDAAWAARALLG